MSRRILGAAAGTLLMAVVVCAAHPDQRSGCFDHHRDFFYSPSNCSSEPEIDRVFRLQAISWKGNDFLFVDEGNEIRVFNINQPLSPVATTGSGFDIPNVGDSDYDLYNFSVCDDCRYGIASYKAGTVLFDMGTGPAPQFLGFSFNDSASIVKGGYTFSVAGQQYLVAATLGSSPCPGNASGLYEFNGIDELSNPLIQCLDNGGPGPQIANGMSVEGTSPPVFYMAEVWDFFRIYRWNPVSEELDYVGNGGIDRANMFRGYGAGVDTSAGLLAVAKSGVLSIYDIGYAVGSPAAPVLLSQMTLAFLPNANAAAIRYPVVKVSQQFSASEPRSYDVSDPINPVPLDQDFWDPSRAWNAFSACVKNNQALFSDDGRALYLSRYSALQVIDSTACFVPIFEDGFESGSTIRWSVIVP